MSSRVQSLLLATCIVSLAGEAKAFEVKHTGVGQLVSWRCPTVAWTIDSSVRKVPGGEAAVVAAVDAWTQRGGAPALAVTQRGAKVGPGLDGINAVVFAEHGFAPAGTNLAVTVLSFDARTGEVLDADIVLNGSYDLGDVATDTTHPTTVADPEGRMYDIGRVVAHEMGHALALSDEFADPTALMNPYVPREVVLATSPAADDVAGLSVLYDDAGGQQAEVASSAPASSCTTAPLRSPRSPATTCVAAGVVLLALGAAIARGARAPRARRGAACATMFAATALVVLPPATVPARHEPGSARLEVRATVTKVTTTTSVHGVFRSELELTPTAAPPGDRLSTYRFVAWGGTIEHVRQVVGGVQLPAVGEPVSLALEPADSEARTQERVVHAITRLAE